MVITNYHILMNLSISFNIEKLLKSPFFTFEIELEKRTKLSRPINIQIGILEWAVTSFHIEDKTRSRE